MPQKNVITDYEYSDYSLSKGFHEYIVTESNVIEREHIFKINYLIWLPKSRLFLSPVASYPADYGYGFCKAVLRKEVTDELLDFVLELDEEELVSFILKNKFLTENQKFKIIAHPKISHLYKAVIVEEAPRSLVTRLLNDTNGLKIYACDSPLLTEDEVLELAQSNVYLERLYFNEHVSLDMVYENFFVTNKSQLVSYSEAEDNEGEMILGELEYVLFIDSFEEFKNVLSRKFNMDMSAYDEQWVRSFVNWKQEDIW